MSRGNTIAIAFVAVAAVLIVALAYNIGGTAEESRSLKMGAITRKRMTSIRERLTKCTLANRAHDDGTMSKESVSRFLQETNELLNSENKMFLQQNQEGVLELEDCNKHLRELREELTGATESNATRMLADLQHDKEKLNTALKVANETRELNRKDLRHLVSAYRMEIRRLTMEIVRAQTSLKEKASNETRRLALKRLAEKAANTTTTTTTTTTTAAPTTTTTEAPAIVVEATEAPAVPEPPKPESVHNEDAAVTPAASTTAKAATTCPEGEDRYSIMMDAGSTGSRTHVYHFKVSKEDSSLKIENEVFESLKPGLSSYKDDADAAANSLVPLMEIAVKSVPREYVGCTPVALKATAGLRLLGEEKSQAILGKVEQVLKKYPFAVGENAAIVMDASDEGPYAWLTVNFLLGNLKAGARTAAIMDMGGASTQVVFTPKDAETLNNAPKEYVYRAKIAGTELAAYQHSFLGLGLKEAGSKLVRAAAAAGGNFVCFPKRHTQEVDGVQVTNAEASNFGDCVSFVQKTLFTQSDEDRAACTHQPCPFRGVFMPDLSTAFDGPLYVFSYFYDRMEPFGISEDDAFTVATFYNTGAKVCESTDEKYASKNLGTMCMDFAYLYSILRHGYGLADTREVLIKKKIDGYETAWALGASLTAMESV